MVDVGAQNLMKHIKCFIICIFLSSFDYTYSFVAHIIHNDSIQIHENQIAVGRWKLPQLNQSINAKIESSINKSLQ